MATKLASGYPTRNVSSPAIKKPASEVGNVKLNMTGFARIPNVSTSLILQ